MVSAVRAASTPANQTTGGDYVCAHHDGTILSLEDGMVFARARMVPADAGEPDASGTPQALVIDFGGGDGDQVRTQPEMCGVVSNRAARVVPPHLAATPRPPLSFLF